MKKVFLMFAFAGFATLATAQNAPTADATAKKETKKACCAKGDASAKACCKKGEAKSCSADKAEGTAATTTKASKAVAAKQQKRR